MSSQAEYAWKTGTQCKPWVGDAVDEIAAEAKQTPLACIVLGTRGRGAIANLLLGSMSSRVACLVDVPVTLVK